LYFQQFSQLSSIQIFSPITGKHFLCNIKNPCFYTCKSLKTPCLLWFGALKSDSTHHFFRNACTKSGSLRFSVFRLLTDFVCLYTYEFWRSLCKIVRSSVILLLPLFNVLWTWHYIFHRYIDWHSKFSISFILSTAHLHVFCCNNLLGDLLLLIIIKFSECW
jgi:hypothetical protein